MYLTAVELDNQTPIAELFQRCAAEPWALLLDSCDREDARFDFIFRQPLQTFTAAENWPETLQQALTILPEYRGPDLPFRGGLAGAFSYDAGRALEQLPSQAQADIALPDLAVGLYCQAVIHDRHAQKYWLVAPNDQIEALRDYWQSSPSKTLPEFALTSAWQSNLNRDEYADRFQRIQDYLQAGDCYQINLAQRHTASFSGDLWHAYQKLRTANKAPFSAFMRLEDGAVLSVSPERFLAIDANGYVETKPIKGTRPRSTNADEDAALARELQSAEKDRAENVMIVDLLRNDLSRLCVPGSVEVPKLFAIESYPAVHHLVSTVVGRLPYNDKSIDLFAACFPGGSITGAPKIRAMEIIDELEPHRRSFYCGSLGYFSQHGAADTSIAIRTLVGSQQQLHCWAGGGIVADSEWQAEYQETHDKVARILPVLSK